MTTASTLGECEASRSKYGGLLYALFALLLAMYPFIWFGLTGERESLNGELGTIELITVVLLLITLVFCVMTFIKVRPVSRPLGIWFMLTVLGTIYFAGEEASWGQHIFGWSTGAGWSEINNQGETNLHNVHGLLDQVPRFIVGLGIFVGGLVFPILMHFKIIKFNQAGILFRAMPEMACILPAILVTVVRPVFTLCEIKFISTGEYKEFLIGLFFLVYSISKYRSIKAYVGSLDSEENAEENTEASPLRE